MVSYTDIGWRMLGIKKDAGVLQSCIRAGGAKEDSGRNKQPITIVHSIVCTRNGLWRRNGGVDDHGTMRLIDKDVISFFIIINVTI